MFDVILFIVVNKSEFDPDTDPRPDGKKKKGDGLSFYFYLPQPCRNQPWNVTQESLIHLRGELSTRQVKRLNHCFTPEFLS